MNFGSGKYTYSLVKSWGMVAAGWTWGEIVGLAVDAQDRVFVASRSQHPLAVFDTDDVGGQLRIAFFAEANLAHHTVDVGGHQAVANGHPLGLELGCVAGDAGAAGPGTACDHARGG